MFSILKITMGHHSMMQSGDDLYLHQILRKYVSQYGSYRLDIILN